MFKLKSKYSLILLSIVLAVVSYPLAIVANDTMSICNAQSQNVDSLITIQDIKQSAQIIVLKDEREANNQHDWTFYILNIIITSLLTLLINYLNSKFEIIKMQKEPSIDRLKTISIEGIKTEKKIYTDLRTAQEHLSFQRNDDALNLVKTVSNYMEENKMDIKPILYTDATDIISYITSIVLGTEMRNEQRERELFDTYYKDYRR
ncbi:MAG: hypothetical protein J5937_01535 [Paludibacteraceae bacterium]|nr:hypothetical protein [Paludibacteraceae bacterium]